MRIVRSLVSAARSTNFPASGCFDNACSDGGTLRSDFVDPRRTPEAVAWGDLIGTTAAANSLTRTAPTTGNFDGTAAITYSRVNGSCVPGTPCPDTVFYTHTGAPATYPLRVDASFREQNATLANVSIVRIQ